MSEFVEKAEDEVLQWVIASEIALLKVELRRDPDELTRLLHPDFLEVGRSGNSFNREAIIKSLLAEKNDECNIVHQDIVGCFVDKNTILITYKTAVKNGDRISSMAKRSSLWVNVGSRWRIRYHQGTPYVDVGSVKGAWVS